MVLSTSQSNQIERWLSEDRVSGDFELLYRGSRDGWKGEDCHAKCDKKGATITVICSSDGLIFGGFSYKPWTSSGRYCESDKSFLFSLKSPSSEVGLTKIRIKQNKCSFALVHRYSYGPTFGGGLDLCIKIGFNTNIKSWSCLGVTYEIPPGQTNTFLVGTKKQSVRD